MTFTQSSIVKKITFLRDKSQEFLWRFMPLLRALKIYRGDLLYAQEDIADEIYFVIEGQFTVYIDLSELLDLPFGTIDPIVNSFNVPFSIFQSGSYFGDSDCITELLQSTQQKCYRDSTAEASDNSEVMVVSKSKLND